MERRHFPGVPRERKGIVSGRITGRGGEKGGGGGLVVVCL